jgi:hypothetical protein
MKDNQEPSKTTTKAGHDPILAVTVLVTGTTIGHAICAAGAQLHLPKSKAEVLAAMDPPRVEITGI